MRESDPMMGIIWAAGTAVAYIALASLLYWMIH